MNLNLSVSLSGSSGAARGAVTAMMEKLLARCAAEVDDEVRLSLAVCLGEVGAISETMLGELKIGNSMGDEAIDSPSSFYKWRLDQPPWRSQKVKYEVQVVTRHLVIALKAAPSSTDQHKIAFAIQQLLHLLNSSSQQSETTGSKPGTASGKQMTEWLRQTLEQSGQYDIVEPYFSSDFKEKVRQDRLSVLTCIPNLTFSPADLRRLLHEETAILQDLSWIFGVGFKLLPVDDSRFETIRLESLARFFLRLSDCDQNRGWFKHC